jgi:hypothetical protein
MQASVDAEEVGLLGDREAAQESIAGRKGVGRGSERRMLLVGTKQNIPKNGGTRTKMCLVHDVTSDDLQALQCRVLIALLNIQ